ncbi:PH domain-containing protein [Pyxidicoccus fallax]|uniref:PH domain-containing protein n=1 Tax=Pyxidicoccus fallax TaxID=394095 RepID=A0A848LG16_9BACT|nr:PH domain-containing protein [Pyxidicoccus fallax]NMO16015.1 PH domain-containing protein [Pyxidicoccus fallax]NPC76972.1 PH domain-containing protein [Pyxidicoccus fallax]
MTDVPHAWLLRLLKVPPAPRLPSGHEGRVFRSAPAFRRYQLLRWGVQQLGVAAGLVAGALFLREFIFHVDYPLSHAIAWVLEGLALLGFLVQLPVGFLVTRLDYAFRWYILSDRSLRVREGLVSLQEKTMTFANIQQVSIQQNPIQRLFGIADVKVETAGGGGSGGSKGGEAHREHLHEAYFRGVDNAAEIRDVILARVRLHRDTGLGEHAPEEPVEPAGTSTAALEAATELLTEMRALRGAMPPRQPR